MSYVRKTWECGDVVTDEALNNIEDGIEEALQGGGGAGLVVHVVDPEDPECEGQKALDKTYAEISAAIKSGVPVTFVRIDEVVTAEYTVEQIFPQTLISLEHVYADDMHECVVNLEDSQTGDQEKYGALGLNEQLKVACDQ